MSDLPIDFDAEAVHLDGVWYTRDELAHKIRVMLDGGDFAVGRPSQALEALNQAMASLRTLAFRVSPAMAEAVHAAAASQGRSAEAIIRDALSRYLGEASESDPVDLRPPSRDLVYGSLQSAPTEELGPRITMEIPLQDVPEPVSHGGTGRSPSVLVDASALVPLDGEPAVELTKKKGTEDDDTLERRWFGS